MEILFTKTGAGEIATVSPIYKIRSASLKATIADIVAKYKTDEKTQNILAALREAFPSGELETMLQSDKLDNVLRLAVLSDKINIADINKRDYNTEISNDNVTLEVFRAMIDVGKTVKATASFLDKDNIAMLVKSLEGDVKSEFWQSQDLIEIESEVARMKDQFRL